MPHDKNGTEVRVGDRVSLPDGREARVLAIRPHATRAGDATAMMEETVTLSECVLIEGHGAESLEARVAAAQYAVLPRGA